MERRTVVSGLLTLALGPLAACGGDGDDDDDEVALTIERLRGPDGGYRELPAGPLLFRSADALAELWRRHEYTSFRMVDGQQQTIRSQPPPVDFSRYAVAGISYGVIADCASPRVVSLVARGDDVVIRYTWVPAPPRSVCVTMDFWLAELFIVPARTRNVVFLEVPPTLP